jgi:hypothetical protein
MCIRLSNLDKGEVSRAFLQFYAEYATTFFSKTYDSIDVYIMN